MSTPGKTPADVLDRLAESARRAEREAIVEFVRGKAEHASEAAKSCTVEAEKHRLRELANYQLSLADEIEGLP